MRGHSLIGKTATLQVVISGSIPDVSKVESKDLNKQASKLRTLKFLLHVYIEKPAYWLILCNILAREAQLVERDLEAV